MSDTEVILDEIIEQMKHREELISLNKWPMLSVILQRFSREVSGFFLNLCGAESVINMKDVTLEGFAGVKKKIAEEQLPVLLNCITLGSKGIFLCSKDLVRYMVDVFAGGDGAIDASNKGEFTRLENEMAKKIINMLLERFAFAFSVVRNMNIIVQDMQYQGDFLEVAKEEDRVVIMEFKISTADVSGEIKFIIPYNGLSMLDKELSELVVEDNVSGAEKWNEVFLGKIDEAIVEVEGLLTTANFSVAQIEKWNIGDKVDIVINDESKVKLKVNGRHLYNGDVGRQGNSVAVKISETLNFEG